MKLDVLGMQAFVAVADEGGFGRAAEVLHLTQAALTRRVQNLERQLGVTLLDRTTRSMALTSLGRDFLPRARRLLGDLSAALLEIRETGDAMRGNVTIACVPTAGVRYLPGVIRRYAAKHPENRVRILDHASADVAEAVLRREAEFGINVAGPQHPDLVALPLFKDRFVLVCRADHALAKRRSLAWKDLEPHPLIYMGAISGNRHLLDAALAGHPLTLRFQFEVQRSSTALGMVAEGLGAAVVPALALQPGTYPDLRIVALRRPMVSRTLVLLTRRNASLSPAARALHDLVVATAGHAAGARKAR